MNRYFEVALDSDGVAVVTLDEEGSKTNKIDPEFTEAFAAFVERLETDPAIKAAVITSAKSTFMVGGDLNSLNSLSQMQNLSTRELIGHLTGFPMLLRRLERCGKPVVAAINGTAMGGGLELALACHYRLIADDAQISLALPEVKLGLMPGAGGTQRLPRLIGIEKAVPLLLEGKGLNPAAALKLGLVGACTPRSALVDQAKKWISEVGTSTQPWDQKGFTVPGGSGILDMKGIAYFYMANGMLQASTLHNYPAPKAIMSAVYEGTMLTIDAGLAIEARYMATLFRDPVAGNMIRTLFINKQKADKLDMRPTASAPSKVQTLGVIGAGMMGAGIAQVAAQEGIDVILIDRDQQHAEAGKAALSQKLDKLVSRGKMGSDRSAAILSRISPTADYANLSGADLVIEAVFEDPKIKADVTARAEKVLSNTAVFASNTSTLRITQLAKASARPANFIGMHFFSPVDRMPLVEIITGDATSQETIAKALDFVRQIGKTPIVVRDSWGFFTSRSFASFTGEGMAMLEEGVAPELIENGARFAGMPVGPLTVQDEVSLELSYNVQASLRQMMGPEYKETAADRVIARMVEVAKRPGRKAGKGFYDYPADGPKSLWQGLAEVFPRAPAQPSLDEVKDRLLYRQSLEAARCLDEGILQRPQDADVGAILGWGFPAYAGGPIALIDTVGTRAFVEKCDRFAERYGDRFSPPEMLRRKAMSGEAVYPA